MPFFRIFVQLFVAKCPKHCFDGVYFCVPWTKSFAVQLNLAKFMYEHNANILPSFFDNFFSKQYNMHNHGTRQPVSDNFYHKRVITEYGKKMLQYVRPVAWDCISDEIKTLPWHMFSYEVKSQVLAGYWLLCEIYTWFVKFLRIV